MMVQNSKSSEVIQHTSNVNDDMNLVFPDGKDLFFIACHFPASFTFLNALILKLHLRNV